MATAKAHVLLNMSESFCGYTRGDQLAYAFTFEVGRPPGPQYHGMLERVFMLGNVDPEDLTDVHACRAQATRYRMAGNRSISVGDVVVLEGYGAFSVQRFGWAELAGQDATAAYAAVEQTSVK